MTDRQRSQPDYVEQPTTDTAPTDDVQGFGGTAGVNPSFIVQPFASKPTNSGDFRQIVQPFAIKPGSGEFGVGVQPFGGRVGGGGEV